MTRKFLAMATAATLALTAFAPAAQAHDRHDRYRGDYSYGHHDGRRHHRDDHGDAVAAGVLGLIVGVALASAASESHDRAPPPPPQYQGYDPGGSAYEDDYGDGAKDQCVRQERQWDRYANRYVTVDVPC